MGLDLKTMLETAAYHEIEIDRVLSPEHSTFLKFDPVLGYIHLDYVFRDGMDETLSIYTHEGIGGPRKVVNYPEQPCRINTYGNSFTQCAQTSDGETWQEILAAHFREPIRNFGVGGYGVYQAYRRAMRHEVTDLAAEYIVLNVWDDDHLRNIDAARWIRVGWMHRDLPRGGDAPSSYPVHGFPWAHVRYDVAQGGFVEHEGMCKKAEDLRQLIGKEGFYNAFKDDHAAHLYCLTQGGEAPVDELEQIAEALALKVDLRTPETRQKNAVKLHRTYGQRSSQYVVSKLRQWCADNGRKLMVLLSYDTPAVKEYLELGTRFDSAFVEFLEREQFTYVDALAKYKMEYADFSLPVDNFLERHYIGRAGAQVFGHYNPAGNFWFASAIRRELVDWLDPKPPAYA